MRVDIDRLPLFDAHMHFSQEHVDAVLAASKECGVIGGINIWVARDYRADYAEHLREMRRRDLGSIAHFWWPDWAGFVADPDGFVARTCTDMRRYAELGTTGLKVWKDLGMYLLHPDGAPATMDDPRLEPIWWTCAELHWTLAVHQADPAHVYQTSTGLTRDELFTRRDRVIAAHPELPFFLCHAGNDIESIDRFTDTLERFPNVTSEVGRELERTDPPGKVHDFLVRYVDRLYIGADIGYQEGRGVDVPWNRDEAYVPMRRRMAQVWGLSGEVLEKIAWRNGVAHFLGSDHRPR